MASVLDGWALGEKIQNAKLDRTRQAQEDAWANEQRNQDRAKWEREAQARTESLGFMDTAIKGYQTPTGLDPAFLEQHGLAPQQAPSPQSTYAQRQGLAPAQFAEPVDGRVQAPAQPAPQAPIPVNPARQRAMTMAQLARANGDYNGFLNAQKQIDDVDTGSKYAQLHSAVMGAPPEKIAAFAKTYSDNATAPGKLTTGKNGLMTLTLDGGDAIQMTRVQAASYVTGLYKMQQGDPTGLNDIAGVSDKLASATEKMWGKLKDVSASNNDAVLKGNQMANDNARTGIAGAHLGLARAKANEKRAPGWSPVGQLDDGTPLYRNSDGRMGLFKAGPNGEPIALSQEDTVRAIKGVSAGRPTMDPADTKEYRTAVLGLGPRPQEKTGFFGGKDDAAGKAWESQKSHIDSVYGAPAAAKSGGAGMPDWGSKTALAKPGAGQQPVSNGQPSKANTRVLSQGAVSQPTFGLGRGLNTYNVEMPDGTTQLLSTDDLEAMGYNLGQTNGRKAYIPGYEG